MKNKKSKVVFLLLFLILSTAAIAQDQITRPVSNIPVQNTEKTVKHLRRPRYHAVMPRRQTRLQFTRFQEKIDLDDKLKKSNKLLDK